MAKAAALAQHQHALLWVEKLEKAAGLQLAKLHADLERTFACVVRPGPTSSPCPCLARSSATSSVPPRPRTGMLGEPTSPRGPSFLRGCRLIDDLKREEDFQEAADAKMAGLPTMHVWRVS